MTPKQARKILRIASPLQNRADGIYDKSGSVLVSYEREAVITLVNAALGEPPAVERALKRLLRAAMSQNAQAQLFCARDYAEAVKDAKAKARKAKR